MVLTEWHQQAVCLLTSLGTVRVVQLVLLAQEGTRKQLAHPLLGALVTHLREKHIAPSVRQARFALLPHKSQYLARQVGILVPPLLSALSVLVEASVLRRRWQRLSLALQGHMRLLPE